MKTTHNRSMKKTLLFSLLVMAASTLYAEEKEDNRNPIGCRDVGYEFDLKTVRLLTSDAGAKQSMYVFFNTSGQKLTLFQMRDSESSRSIYLNHVIGPKEWSVLSTAERKMKFICTTPEAKNSYGQVVNCADYLRICEYTNVRFGLNNKGNYWLVNSTSKNSAIREVVRYGIIPGA